MTMRTLKHLWMAAGLMAAALVIVGCSKSGSPDEPTPAAAKEPAAKSTAETAIDGFTGKTALESHKKAKSTLARVNATREQDIQDATGTTE